MDRRNRVMLFIIPSYFYEQYHPWMDVNRETRGTKTGVGLFISVLEGHKTRE
jgi:hypothetical protein